jgi:hypothetical protein
MRKSVRKQEVLFLINKTWNEILEARGLPRTALSEEMTLLGDASPIDSSSSHRS